MRFFPRPAKYAHERNFVAAVAGCLRRLGHKQAQHDRCADLIVQWGARSPLPNTLYCELGWLPRWSYQISWQGINGQHHAAGKQPTKPTDRAAVLETLARLRRGEGMPRGGWGYCDPTVPPSDAFRVPYILAPLQVPTDVNMGDLPTHLRTPQQFVDHVSEMAPRVYFKQHPARSEREQQITVRSPHKLIPHRQGQVAGYLKSVPCDGVIVGNSNVAHDAILHGKPAHTLGRGFWGEARFMRPRSNATLAYLEHLFAHQWTVKTTTPDRVRQLLEEMPP